MEDTWYEVYEFVDGDIINGTQTLEVFDTRREAEEYCKDNPNQFIDHWKMGENGIPVRVF
jgi:hypothetical protein